MRGAGKDDTPRDLGSLAKSTEAELDAGCLPAGPITLHDASMAAHMDAAPHKVNPATIAALVRLMPMPDDRPDDDDAPHFTAQEARGGDIVLRTPGRRAIFIAGLMLIIVVAVIGYWIA